MNKILVVVDMQNDFLTGTLANESAVNVIPNIKREIESGKYNHIIFTRDTHTERYLETQEGKRLPVTHCIAGSKGWNVCDELLDSISVYYIYENSLHTKYTIDRIIYLAFSKFLWSFSYHS